VQRGHDVDSALDGAEGSAKFSAKHYDVVVCDIVMPEKEGVETITQMRQSRADVGIVAISGGLSRLAGRAPDILDMAAKLGANKTLTKPFQLSDLVDAVDAAAQTQPAVSNPSPGN
jgi:DNA-binding response OmpR family regulator